MSLRLILRDYKKTTVCGDQGESEYLLKIKMGTGRVSPNSGILSGKDRVPRESRRGVEELPKDVFVNPSFLATAQT